MGFEIVKSKRPAKCHECGEEIKTGEWKLRFTYILGYASVNKSLCLNCFDKIARALDYGYCPDCEDRIGEPLRDESRD